MLLHFATDSLALSDFFSAHVGVRSLGAFFSSFVIVLAVMPGFIASIVRRYSFQSERDFLHNPEIHVQKNKTPSMGGVIMLLAILLSVFFWCSSANIYVWMVIFIMIYFGMIGLIDDLKKAKNKNTKGLRMKTRLVMEFLAAIAFIYAINRYSEGIDGYQDQIFLPFAQNFVISSVSLSFLLRIGAIVGTANAVNLTDGLDGLAVMPTIITAISIAVVAYAAGSWQYASIFSWIYIDGAKDLVIFCAAIVGAGLGFLWYNANPAEIFMGDVGSLGLGGAIASIAVICKAELFLMISGAIFAINALAVMLQIISFKLAKKRIFPIAPLHHYFILIGHKESKVVVRAWILSIFFATLALILLKTR